MKNWLIISILFVSSIVSTTGSAQTNPLSIEESYDELTERWLKISSILKDYEGLSSFCLQPDFRKYTVETLNLLHQYDSVVIDFMADPANQILIGSNEIQKTLKEIDEFESKYSVQAFLDYLKDGCYSRNAIEKDKKQSSLANGVYSYDGQVVVLEADISKYLKNIDKRIVSIDQHLHRIQPDRFQFNGTLTSND